MSRYLYHGPEHLERSCSESRRLFAAGRKKAVDLWKHHGEILEAAGRSACTRMEGRLLQLQAAQERCETNQTRTLAPEPFHHPCRLCRFQYSKEILVIFAEEHKWPSRPQFVLQKSITRGVARGKQQAFEQPKFSKIVPWKSGRLLSRSLQQLEFMLQVLI